MREYIEKEELLRDLERKIKADNERRMAVVDSDFIDLVNDATVVEDVVEVVRCKDCKWCQVENWDGEILYGCDCCAGLNDVEPDGFCSYGERKEPI